MQGVTAPHAPRSQQVVFTLFRQPGMSDGDFDQDAAMVEKDLATLRQMLESREPAGSDQP